MFDKAKEAVNGVMKNIEQKQLEKQQMRLNEEKRKAERELAEKRAKQAQMEAEQEKIRKEEERLAGLPTNELLAEAVMAIRGFYAQFESLQSMCSQNDLRIDVLEDDIKRINSQIEGVRADIDRLTDERNSSY